MMRFGGLRTAFLAAAIAVLAVGAAPGSAEERSFSQAQAAMLAGLKASDQSVRANAPYELEGFDDEDAARALVRFVLARDDRAPVVRAGVQLLGGMRSPEALKVLTEELTDGKWEKRARVAWALGRWGTDAALAPLLRVAYDEDPRVRTSVLLALEGAPGGRVDLALADALRAAEWPVRSAAIHVLKQRKPKQALPALVDRLAPGAEEGRLLDDVREALVRITGEDFGVSHLRWRRYIATQTGEAMPAEPGPGAVSTTEPRAELAGLRTRAKRVVYVLALNQSMNEEVRADGAEKAPPDVRERGGETLERWAKARTRLDYARLWLDWSIGRLAPDAEFEIVTYGAGANGVFSGFLPATPANREKARRRVLSLSASGNANFHAALVKTFTITHPDPLHPESIAGGPEVVFFLSDGTSDVGEIRDPFAAFQEAERWNRYRQIRFHVIGVGQSDLRTLADLAGMAPGGAVVGIP